MAVEFLGAEASRPWLERAGASFPTVIDSGNVLGTLFGYKAIPNGILLDQTGAVRYTKFGGFSVGNGDDVVAVEHLLAGTGDASAAESAPALAHGGETTQVQSRLSALDAGLERLRRGDRAGAVAAWREALAQDPESYIIRKQIWAVEHPERFYPTIDWAWQKEQLAHEREAERSGS